MLFKSAEFFIFMPVDITPDEGAGPMVCILIQMKYAAF
jgi:hypothetical protein